ncbi:hypothetical protein [Photobacterium damselae]|uniref:hypothetical protein n=1 Tax=Photobacterium damselae TaxID=38293 RepID=UPI001F1D6F0F|nr:hypothetical protein [Photobacterium damselae]UKA04885.1 hypothetical protein IHC89_21820 [Photobacterium damselae subsp. damselae]
MAISTLKELHAYVLQKQKEVFQLEVQQQENQVNLLLLHTDQDYETEENDEDIFLSRSIDVIKNLAKVLPELAGVASDLQKNYDNNITAINEHNDSIFKKFSSRESMNELLNTFFDFSNGRSVKESRLTRKFLLIKSKNGVVRDNKTSFYLLIEKALSGLDVIVHSVWREDTAIVYINDNLSEDEVCLLIEMIAEKLRESVCEMDIEVRQCDDIEFIGTKCETSLIRKKSNSYNLKQLISMIEDVL